MEMETEMIHEEKSWVWRRDSESSRQQTTSVQLCQNKQLVYFSKPLGFLSLFLSIKSNEFVPKQNGATPKTPFASNKLLPIHLSASL